MAGSHGLLTLFTVGATLVGGAVVGCGSDVAPATSGGGGALTTGGAGGAGGAGATGGAGASGGEGGAADACPDPDGTFVRFDPLLTPLGVDEATQWLAYPFPADHRRTDAGTVDLGDFPNPNDVTLLQAYIDLGTASLDGFGTNSPAYFSFTGPVDTSALSAEMADYVDSRARMYLLDVTPSSPGFGERVPLRWTYQDSGGTYVPANTLAVAPGWGFPLRERTTYAAVITTAVPDANGKPLQTPALLTELLGETLPARCAPSVPANYADLDAQFAGLREALATEGTPPATVAAATVFTTQDVTGELGAIRDHIYGSLPAPALGDTWQELGGVGSYSQAHTFQWTTTGDAVDYYELAGTFPSPNYQHGTIPYADVEDGGGFAFDSGVPLVAATEQLRFYLTIPALPPVDGPCYPIVEYAHGTTGSAAGFVSTTGGRLAARGLAAIGIDQPLHGPRWAGSSNAGQLELYSYNFTNPAAGRTLLRQSAADTFSLTRFVLESLVIPADKSPTGAPVCFDGTRIAFFGHSQGGLAGALAAAYEDNVATWVLSGTSGGQSITMMERKEPANILLLVSILLGPSPGEAITEDHPAIALVQTIAEVTDGLNYAPYWSERLDLSDPVHLLLTSGTLDAASPARGAAALAVAARIPVVAPVAVPIPAYGAAGLLPVAAPASATVNGATAGFMQWDDDGLDASHYVVFQRPEAIHASMRLLESASFEAAAVLERDPLTTDQ